VRYWLREHDDYNVRVLDKLTYAGSMENLEDVLDDPRLTFVKGDVCDPATVDEVMSGVHTVVHFAAETHVDRSILDAGQFVQTDVYGTFVVLETARRHGVDRFLQISTDEVYGSVAEGAAAEDWALMPRNPYSATKAAADRMAYAFFVTHGLPVVITRACNNYGPYQYPEKLIPFFITRAMRSEPLPLYGDGRQVRDWLHVLDNCRAIDLLIERGEPGEVYNVGADNERTNIEIANIILDELRLPENLIAFVKDRPGHDRRYALESSKLRQLGWAPTAEFDTTLRETIRWFRDHQDWCDRSLERSRAYFEAQYHER